MYDHSLIKRKKLIYYCTKTITKLGLTFVTMSYYQKHKNFTFDFTDKKLVHVLCFFLYSYQKVYQINKKKSPGNFNE